MKLNYTAKAISLYAKQTGKNVSELAAILGVGTTTLNRYIKGERLPDIEILLRICNTLHLCINQFFVHPAIELSEVRILRPEEWSDITFRYDRIEAIRLERGWTKKELVERINTCAGTSVTRLTYNHLIVGEHFSYATILGLMEATGVGLDYLFEQRLPIPDEDSVLVSRRVLEEKDKYITRLEDTVRELELKYKRLEKRTLPRYEERMGNLDARKVINTFIRQVERNLIELRSWTSEDGHSKPKPYGDIIDNTLMVADAGIVKEDDGRAETLV